MFFNRQLKSMEIKIKATARLKPYLQALTLESGILQVSDSCSVASIIELLALPDDEPFVCIVNNKMIPLSKLKQYFLHENDELSLIPPIRGG